MPKNKLYALAGIIFAITLISGCSMMAKMMGKGDLMGAMENMDKVLKDMPMDQRMSHMNGIQAATLNKGTALFSDASLGKDGQSCNSCHPGGGTTGGEAQVPMRDYRIPIPNLACVAATFPKYKVPNDRVITLEVMNNRRRPS